MSDKVFVYGTLRRGFENFGLLEKEIKSVTTAAIRGIMYDLGDYPAVIAGDGIVAGEILEFHDPAHAFHLMDLLEEYNGPGHPDNEYERVHLEAETEEGSAVICQVYLYSEARLEELEQFDRVEQGDWAARRRVSDRL